MPVPTASRSTVVGALRPRPAAALVAARPSLRTRRADRGASLSIHASADAAAAPPPASDAPVDDKVSVVAIARAMMFYLVTFTLALPLFAIMLAIFPFAYLTDRYRRYALSFVNDIWATISTFLFFRVEVIGRENLPSVETPQCTWPTTPVTSTSTPSSTSAAHSSSSAR